MRKQKNYKGDLCIFREGSLSAPEGGVITVQPEAAGSEEEMETRNYSQTDEHNEEHHVPSADHEGMMPNYLTVDTQCTIQIQRTYLVIPPTFHTLF